MVTIKKKSIKLDEAGVNAAIKAFGGYRGNILSNPKKFCELLIRAYLRNCTTKEVSKHTMNADDV